MKDAICIICLAMAITGCGNIGQNHTKERQAENLNKCVPIVEATILHWFSSDMMFSQAKSSIVRIYSDVLSKSDTIDIPGMQVILSPASEYRLDVQKSYPKSSAYLICIRHLEIAEDEARVNFSTTDEDYHQWSFVNCNLHRSGGKWVVYDLAGGM